MDNEDSSIDLRPFLRWVPDAVFKADNFPEGFQFVLPFLDLPSRLTVERINKASKEALKDPLLWVDLTIKSNSSHLTDENLLKLAERADGHLKSLILEGASKITDEALSRIFELNPGLERISVRGCWELNSESFVSLVEAQAVSARAKGFPGIREVRLTGLGESRYHDHLVRRLVTTVTALGFSRMPQNEASPSGHYYGSRHDHSEDTEERPMDVELCSKCACTRLIYDCTNHNHWLKDSACIEHDSSEVKYYNNLEEHEYYKVCRFCIRCEKCGTRISISTRDNNYYDYSSTYSDYGYYDRYYEFMTIGEDSSNVAGLEGVHPYPKEDHHSNRRCAETGSNWRPKRVGSRRVPKESHHFNRRRAGTAHGLRSSSAGSNRWPKKVRSGREGKGKHQFPLGLNDVHLKGHTSVKALVSGGSDDDESPLELLRGHSPPAIDMYEEFSRSGVLSCVHAG